MYQSEPERDTTGSHVPDENTTAGPLELIPTRLLDALENQDWNGPAHICDHAIDQITTWRAQHNTR